jgi:AcrR family transcriptional regulator
MPKRVDHGTRREEIARAALRLCVREGLASVTVGRVAAEASISKGLVQHYFPAKEALLRLAAATQRHDIESAVAAAVRPGDPPEAMLRQILVALVDLGTEQILAGHAFLASAAADPLLHRLYQEGSSAATATIARLVTETRDSAPTTGPGPRTGPATHPDTHADSRLDSHAHSRPDTHPDLVPNQVTDAEVEARILLGVAGALADARMLGEIDRGEAIAVLDLQLSRLRARPAG